MTSVNDTGVLASQHAQDTEKAVLPEENQITDSSSGQSPAPEPKPDDAEAGKPAAGIKVRGNRNPRVSLGFEADYGL
jgi:hypothetical protein